MRTPGMTSMRSIFILSAAGALLLGCSRAPDEVGGPALAIDVAALTLEGVTDGCYTLTITNEDGETVWTQDQLCGSRFGHDASIAYVAPCDATDSDGGGAFNTVTLTLDTLRGPGGSTLTDWADPCPGGCVQQALCAENADTEVRFDLTIMRAANQGFFDIAVNFADVFCSAKVDCAGADGDALRLVHDPDSGLRVESVVLGFACTDGSPPGAAEVTTHLYRDPIDIVCGGATYTVDPTGGPGNLYPGGVGAPPPLVQAMVFEGREALVDQRTGAPADKLYWNVALGVDAAWFVAQEAGTTCTLRTRMTASEGPLPGGEIDVDSGYPYLAVDLPLWTTGPTGARQCSRHPLDGDVEGVSAVYAKRGDDPSFAYVAAVVGGALATTPVDACDPAVHASDPDACGCALAVCGAGELCAAGVCACDPAAHLGDPSSCGCPSVTCATDELCADGVCACDPAAHASDASACGCPGVQCGEGERCVEGACACPPGWAGSPETGCEEVSAPVSGLYAFGGTQSWRSTDGGSSWSSVAGTGFDGTKVISGGRLMVATGDRVLMSGDAATWTQVLDIGPEGVNADGWQERRFYRWLSVGDGQVFYTIRRIYCLGMFDCTANELATWRSDDGGFTWTEVGTVSHGAPVWNHAGKWYANVWADGSQTSGWVESSDGVNWTTSTCAIPVDGEDQTWTPVGSVLLHRWGTAIKQSTDDGCTWSLRTNLPSAPPVQQLACNGDRCIGSGIVDGAWRNPPGMNEAQNTIYVFDGTASTTTIPPAQAENGFVDDTNLGRIWSGLYASGDLYFHDCLRCRASETRSLAIFDVGTNTRTFTNLVNSYVTQMIAVP